MLRAPIVRIPSNRRIPIEPQCYTACSVRKVNSISRSDCSDSFRKVNSPELHRYLLVTHLPDFNVVDASLQRYATTHLRSSHMLGPSLAPEGSNRASPAARR